MQRRFLEMRDHKQHEMLVTEAAEKSAVGVAEEPIMDIADDHESLARGHNSWPSGWGAQTSVAVAVIDEALFEARQIAF